MVLSSTSDASELLLVDVVAVWLLWDELVAVVRAGAVTHDD